MLELCDQTDGSKVWTSCIHTPSHLHYKLQKNSRKVKAEVKLPPFTCQCQHLHLVFSSIFSCINWSGQNDVTPTYAWGTKFILVPRCAKMYTELLACNFLQFCLFLLYKFEVHIKEEVFMVEVIITVKDLSCCLFEDAYICCNHLNQKPL